MGSVSTLLAVGFFGFKAKNEIGCFLSLRRCLHNQGLVILQAFQPVLNIRSGVFRSGFADPLMRRLFERRQGFDDGLHIPTSTSPGPRDRSGKVSAEAAMPFGGETGIAR